MASARENLETSYETLTAKLVEATASVAPDITVDGVTIARASYIKTLTDQIEALRKVRAATRRPYYLRSRRRG